jgi:steroid 5-alpha reductase family enzyme
MKLTSKPKALAWVAAAYAAALAVALCLGLLADLDPLWTALACDLAATLVVFVFSIGFNNSSMYDPYWSLAPIAIALYWALNPTAIDVDLIRRILVVGLVCLWGLRLTYNWIRRWKGLEHEDWRYANFRTRCGRAYWLVSLLGIHLFPTAIVFAGCLPLVPALLTGSSSFGLLDVAAIGLTTLAIWVEATADKQLHRHLSSSPDAQTTLSSGLWAYCRHPNYFGEVAFWWGAYLFGLAADPAYWWTVVGPVAMTALFAFVSVPMIDRRMLKRRPDYTARMNTVPGLVPWFPRKTPPDSSTNPDL